jgi:hypothetical protein
MSLLRHEILANRRKVINFLKQPKRIKATGALDRGNGKRCCLGHMCYVLRIPRNSNSNVNNWGYGKNKNFSYAPHETITKLGLFNQSGGVLSQAVIQIKDYHWQCSLADINDSTKATSQEIGEYLESVIEGGINTPWKSLTDYPEQ